MNKKPLFLMLCCFVSLAASAVVVDKTTKVENQIANPILPEQTAEKELRTYLEKIFGKYTPSSSNKKIILKYDAKLGKEEFTLKSNNDNTLTISGGRPRGVLYGAYYFLDRKLGVHWLTPSVEYVPSKTKVDLGNLNYFGKPAFNARLLLCLDDKFAARNLVNVNSGSSKYSKEYGFEKFFGPNGFAHNLAFIIPPSRFFKKYPEIYALQRGKRRHGNATGITASYCLSNPKLAEVVVEEARKYLKANPNTTYFGIEEGDFTEGNCSCENCKAAELKYGKRVGGCWTLFANRVSSALKKEFPNVIFKTFAYLSSKRPPVNIKANDNVAVHYCAWGQRFGLAYSDPRNQSGKELINDLKNWKKVSKRLLIWDYVACMGNLISNADSLQNIDNMKLFHSFGVEGVFPEGSSPEDVGVYGASFRSWLLARAMWNPYECNGEELERTFCKEYFGEKAGAKIAEYYKTYRDVNKKEGFWRFTMAGPLSGTPKFMGPQVTAKVYKLVKEAYALAETPEHKKRVQGAMTNIQYLILRNYNEMKKANLIDESYDAVEKSLWDFLKANATAYRFNTNFSKQIKQLSLRNKIKATAQAEYASIAQYAYDGDVNTNWHFAGPKAWCQIEFPEVKEITRITTVLDRYGTLESHYKIAGSLDGKEWFELVPPSFVKGSDFKDRQYLYADDKLEKPVKVKFVRTYRTGSKLRANVFNDALLFEQAFNLKEIPAEYKKVVQSTRRRPTLLIPYSVKDFTPKYNNFSYFDSKITKTGLISGKSTQFASVLLFSYDKPIKVTIEYETKNGAGLYVQHERKAKTPRHVLSKDFPVVSIYIPKEDQQRMRSSLKLMNLSRRGNVHIKSIKVEDATDKDLTKYEKDLKDWTNAFLKNNKKKRPVAPKNNKTVTKVVKAKAPVLLSIPANIKFGETLGVRVIQGNIIDKDGVLIGKKPGNFLSINLPASEKSLKITMKVHTVEKALLGILHDNRLQKIKRTSYGWGSKFDYMQTHTFTIPSDRLKTPSVLSFHRMTKHSGEVRIKDMKIEAVK